jgi:uncharacterized protein
MKNAVFVDTGAFIALADAGDQFHTHAQEALAVIDKMGPQVTSPFVLVEACEFLQRCVGPEAGRRLWDSVLSGEAEVKLLEEERRDLERAHEISTHYSDQKFSWVDCISFALIERHKISGAFSFDKDFLIFKFSHGPLHRIP